MRTKPDVAPDSGTVLQAIVLALFYSGFIVAPGDGVIVPRSPECPPPPAPCAPQAAAARSVHHLTSCMILCSVLRVQIKSKVNFGSPFRRKLTTVYVRKSWRFRISAIVNRNVCCKLCAVDFNKKTICITMAERIFLTW